MRAYLDRFEGYFGLIQKQFTEQNGEISSLRGQISAMQEQISSMDERLGRLEVRMDASDARLGVMAIQIGGVRSDLETLRFEMRERFISADEQMRTLSQRVQVFETRVGDDLDIVVRQLASLQERMKAVEEGNLNFNRRLDTLGDDMRQRFRLVIERLGEMDKRNAA